MKWDFYSAASHIAFWPADEGGHEAIVDLTLTLTGEAHDGILDRSGLDLQHHGRAAVP